MDTIWTSLGDTSTKFTNTSSMFTYGVTSITFAVLASWNISVLGPEWIIYAGSLIYLFSSLCIAAYLAVKVVDAAVNFTEGMAYIYRDHSWLGNGLGLWEAFWAVWFLWWSAGITYEAFDNTYNLTQEMGKREMAVLTEGSLGHAVDVIQAIQHFVLLMVLTVVTWIVGCSLADSMEELINFFDKYDDKTDDESTDNDSSNRDVAGTGIYYDLLYHTLTIMGVEVLFGTMMLGAYWFYSFSGFADFKPVGNCDLDETDASRYNGLVSDIESITLGSYQECQNIVKNIYKQMDLDGNNYIERCEDAKFLKGIGNTDEYSLTYSSARTLPQAMDICNYLVIDAFDQQEKADDSLMTLIFQLANGMFPTSLLNHGDSDGFLGMRPMSLK